MQGPNLQRVGIFIWGMAMRSKRLKWSLLIVFCLTLFLILVPISLLFISPNILLHRSVMGFVLNQLKSNGIVVEHDVGKKHLGWSKFPTLELRVEFNKLCAQWEGNHLCIRNGDVQLKLRWGFPFNFTLKQVGPGNISAIDWKGKSKSDEYVSVGTPPAFELPFWLADCTFKKLTLESGDVFHQTETSSLKSHFTVNCEAINEDLSECRLPVKMDLQEIGEPKIKVVGNLKFSVDKEKGFTTRLIAQAHRVQKQERMLHIQFNGGITPEHNLRFDLKTEGTFQDVLFRTSTTGGGSPKTKKIAATTDATCELFPGFPFENQLPMGVSLKGCNMVLNTRNRQVKMASCPIKIQAKKEDKKTVLLYANILSGLNLSLDPLDMDLEFDMPKQTDNYLSFEGKIRTSLKEEKKDAKVYLSILPTSTFQLGTQHFKKLAKSLVYTKYEIPAPLNAMDGEIGLKLEKIIVEPEALKIPVKGSVRLKSQYQQLNLDLMNELSLGRAFGELSPLKVRSQILIKETTFQLPELNWSTPSGLTPDTRIGTQAVPENTQNDIEDPIDWELNLKTYQGSRVMISTNLFKKPIPFYVNMTVDSRGNLKGTCSMEPIDLELFRRKAEVKRFVAKIHKERYGRPRIELQGNIKVVYPDYTVDININGPTDDPAITFESSPPLDRKQILSLLIFGEKLEEQDRSKNLSAERMDSVIAKRSLSLATLYLFASTPIRNITYDPDTQAVSASFRWKDDTIIEISSDNDGQESVGIRKRLGNNWSFSTNARLGNETDRTMVSGFLEWFKRY